MVGMNRMKLVVEQPPVIDVRVSAIMVAFTRQGQQQCQVDSGQGQNTVL